MQLALEEKELKNIKNNLAKLELQLIEIFHKLFSSFQEHLRSGVIGFLQKYIVFTNQMPFDRFPVHFTSEFVEIAVKIAELELQCSRDAKEKEENDSKIQSLIQRRRAQISKSTARLPSEASGVSGSMTSRSFFNGKLQKVQEKLHSCVAEKSKNANSSIFYKEDVSTWRPGTQREEEYQRVLQETSQSEEALKRNLELIEKTKKELFEFLQKKYFQKNFNEANLHKAKNILVTFFGWEKTKQVLIEMLRNHGEFEMKMAKTRSIKVNEAKIKSEKASLVLIPSLNSMEQ